MEWQELPFSGMSGISIAAMELAHRITRRGGTPITAGLPNPAPSLVFAGLVGEDRTLRGSCIRWSVPVRDIPRYVDMYQRGKLPVNRLMGEQLALADINAGLDRLATGHSLRDVVVSTREADLPLGGEPAPTESLSTSRSTIGNIRASQS